MWRWGQAPSTVIRRFLGPMVAAGLGGRLLKARRARDGPGGRLRRRFRQRACRRLDAGGGRVRLRRLRPPRSPGLRIGRGLGVRCARGSSPCPRLGRWRLLRGRPSRGLVGGHGAGRLGGSRGFVRVRRLGYLGDGAAWAPRPRCPTRWRRGRSSGRLGLGHPAVGRGVPRRRRLRLCAARPRRVPRRRRGSAAASAAASSGSRLAARRRSGRPSPDSTGDLLGRLWLPGLLDRPARCTAAAIGLRSIELQPLADLARSSSGISNSAGSYRISSALGTASSSVA